MRRIILTFILLIILPFLSGACREEEIDANSASKSELGKLTGMGSVKARAIIDARPFSSVNDLTDVKDVGEKTLDGMKSRGLVCVFEPDDDEERPDNERISSSSRSENDGERTRAGESTKSTPDVTTNRTEAKKETVTTTEKISIPPQNTDGEITVNVNLPQDINNEEDKDMDEEKSGESGPCNCEIYVLAGFCVLLAVLFVFRFIDGKKCGTEFEK